MKQQGQQRQLRNNNSTNKPQPPQAAPKHKPPQAPPKLDPQYPTGFRYIEQKVNEKENLKIMAQNGFYAPKFNDNTDVSQFKFISIAEATERKMTFRHGIGAALNYGGTTMSVDEYMKWIKSWMSPYDMGLFHALIDVKPDRHDDPARFWCFLTESAQEIGHNMKALVNAGYTLPDTGRDVRQQVQLCVRGREFVVAIRKASINNKRLKVKMAIREASKSFFTDDETTLPQFPRISHLMTDPQVNAFAESKNKQPWDDYNSDAKSVKVEYGNDSDFVQKNIYRCYTHKAYWMEQSMCRQFHLSSNVRGKGSDPHCASYKYDKKDEFSQTFDDKSSVMWREDEFEQESTNGQTAIDKYCNGMQVYVCFVWFFFLMFCHVLFGFFCFVLLCFVLFFLFCFVLFCFWP